MYSSRVVGDNVRVEIARVVNHVIGMGSIFSEAQNIWDATAKIISEFLFNESFQKSFAHTVFQNQDDYYDWIKLAGLSTKQVSRIPGSIEWQDVKQNGGAALGFCMSEGCCEIKA